MAGWHFGHGQLPRPDLPTPCRMKPVGRAALFLGYYFDYNIFMTTLNDIIDAAQGLPSSERAQLIHVLWDSISPEDWAPPTEAWINESQRRSKAYDDGQMTASPWSEVRERVRRKVGLDD